MLTPTPAAYAKARFSLLDPNSRSQDRVAVSLVEKADALKPIVSDACVKALQRMHHLRPVSVDTRDMTTMYAVAVALHWEQPPFMLTSQESCSDVAAVHVQRMANTDAMTIICQAFDRGAGWDCGHVPRARELLLRGVCLPAWADEYARTGSVVFEDDLIGESTTIHGVCVFCAEPQRAIAPTWCKQIFIEVLDVVDDEKQRMTDADYKFLCDQISALKKLSEANTPVPARRLKRFTCDMEFILHEPLSKDERSVYTTTRTVRVELICRPAPRRLTTTEPQCLLMEGMYHDHWLRTYEEDKVLRFKKESVLGTAVTVVWVQDVLPFTF
tara:strand:- start:221 stop:1204 length:984 start_codon:yes stop_codon:yes gene_type:complete